ncbi:disease resistance protein RPS2-like [Abrus precatorius]|uniref:Disease resistance protein RPS2-like n=1 Tax=Abrus precatorius TaxID=3816 RepID=A0A8B8KMC8_ABRPR|nr:disease resistance protein RPS2-like [Abrus precatorius]
MQHMNPCLGKARDFLKKETEGTSTIKDEFSYKEELLSLMRIRDFISLLLTYPVKFEEEGILKAWTNAFSEWKAQLLSNDDDAMVKKPWRVLTERALTFIEGLVPVEITSQIKRGERYIFNHNYAVPESVRHLSSDLAVEQLIQTLFSGDDYARSMRHVRLSTRNFAEKMDVVNKIAQALEDKHHRFGIDKDFPRALWIYASTYENESNAEDRIQEEISLMMTEEMESKRNLVILVDREGEKKLDLDPQKMCFPPGIVVWITTEEEGNELTNTVTCMMDLNIRTQDHLLPWEVSCYYVGRITSRFSSGIIPFLACEIVELCGGHLLAIVLVAKSLKNVENLQQWERALQKLGNPCYDYIYHWSDRIGIRRVMVNAFVYSVWEGINKTQKLCLELSLFVDKIKIGVPSETLMFNWISTESAHVQETAQPFFTTDSDDDELKSTKEADNHMREFLDRSILLQCEGSSNVRLPIEVYNIIKWLHIFNPSIIRCGASALIELPYIGRWRDLIRIELMDNKICELPLSPDCPKLKVLLLQGNVDLMDIPDSFFDHMPLLLYLDLSNTSVRNLPPSISKLTELKKLYLRGCDLFMELSPRIGQLKKLEELDLDGTLITYLPKEIRELINLQRLNLFFDRELRHEKGSKQIYKSTIIPPGIISNLTLLNYLSINVDPEDERWNENVTNILVEIFELERLETVNIYIPKTDLLELIPAHKPIDFRLVVGHHMRRFISRVTPKEEEKFKQCDRSLKFVNGENVPNRVKKNLGRFRALYLDRHMTIKSLSEFGLKNLHRLQVCLLGECNEMETIVDGSYSYDGYALPNLEFLSVFYMKSLTSIYKGPPRMDPSFLHSLKFMALHTCPMLTTIFSLDFLDNLSLLEELIVVDCPKVTTLISYNSIKHVTRVFLPRLRNISLLYLPELVSIFNGLHVGGALEKMGFYYCPKLRSLSKTELSSKCLTIIKGENRWWKSLKWKEAEWGAVGRPNFLDLIFSPINDDTDIMTQLATRNHEDRGSKSMACQTKQKIPETQEEVLNSTKQAFELVPKLQKFDVIVVPENNMVSGCGDVEGSDRSTVPEGEMQGIESSPSRPSKRKNNDEERKILVCAPVGSTEIPPEDGFPWRKYGQKQILGYKFPRNYYRCIYRYKCECLARKLVQRLDDDPNMFEVTYRGEHTCHALSTSASFPLITTKLGNISKDMTQTQSTSSQEPFKRDCPQQQ